MKKIRLILKYFILQNINDVNKFFKNSIDSGLIGLYIAILYIIMSYLIGKIYLWINPSTKSYINMIDMHLDAFGFGFIFLTFCAIGILICLSVYLIAAHIKSNFIKAYNKAIKELKQ